MLHGGGDFEETQTDKAIRMIKLSLTIAIIAFFTGIGLVVWLVSLAIN